MTDSTSNGSPQYPERERQYCPACKTPGDHTFVSAGATSEDPVYYACANCGHKHVKHAIVKLPPTDSSQWSTARKPVASVPAELVATTLPNDVVTAVREREKLSRKDQPLDEIQKAPHYNFSKYEVIDVVEDWALEPHEFTAVIYIARAMHKGQRLKDLKKAVWFLERKIALLEEQAAEAQNTQQTQQAVRQ